jgi:hypothetical protein
MKSSLTVLCHYPTCGFLYNWGAQVLGVSPLEKFDTIKATYRRKHKDAERQGNEAAMARFDQAYDRIMMTQLSNRKQGLTFGSFEVG